MTGGREQSSTSSSRIVRLASVDRQKQPWLIFAAHRVLGYTSDKWYSQGGAFEEPMGRESLQKLWQKYKVDIAFYGHVHNYERTCPIYEVWIENLSFNLQFKAALHLYNGFDFLHCVVVLQKQCVSSERSHYSGKFNGTVHVVVGGAGSHLSDFSQQQPNWSLYRDHDWGFVKMTAFNHTSLLFEYKKSSDGKVYDSFTISRDYTDVLACVLDSSEPTTAAF